MHVKQWKDCLLNNAEFICGKQTRGMTSKTNNAFSLSSVLIQIILIMQSNDRNLPDSVGTLTSLLFFFFFF